MRSKLREAREAADLNQGDLANLVGYVDQLLVNGKRGLLLHLPITVRECVRPSIIKRKTSLRLKVKMRVKNKTRMSIAQKNEQI